MGVCCTKLDSIEHVSSLEDLKFIVKNDINMYAHQHRIMKEDKVIN